MRARPDADFALPVAACPGWTVRDVLAHCSAALTRVVENRFEEGVFSPESNDRDIADRADWSDAQVVDELERGHDRGRAGDRPGRRALDGIALGEWVHAGDVRRPSGSRGRTPGPGCPDALALLARLTRERRHVPLHADLDDVDEPLRLGEATGSGPRAGSSGTAATLVRLYAGRPVGCRRTSWPGWRRRS